MQHSMKKHLLTSGFILVELMNITAIIAIPAAVAIPQYFRSIKIAGAPSVVGHFRIAAGARSCRHRGQQRPGLYTYITDGGHLVI